VDKYLSIQATKKKVAVSGKNWPEAQRALK
jgi:hypothetical protein